MPACEGPRGTQAIAEGRSGRQRIAIATVRWEVLQPLRALVGADMCRGVHDDTMEEGRRAHFGIFPKLKGGVEFGTRH